MAITKGELADLIWSWATLPEHLRQQARRQSEHLASIERQLTRLSHHLELDMADITQAEQDLADAVSSVGQRVSTDFAALKALIASGGTQADLQAAADKIEANVALLTSIDPATPPTPVTDPGAPPTGDPGAPPAP